MGKWKGGQLVPRFVHCEAAGWPTNDDMASSSPSSSAADFSEASLNTLQLALRTMKERCSRQDARIGELEDDNAHLRTDR